MKLRLLRILLFSLVFLWLCPVKTVYAEYIEGIDTTDSNGFGLDSSFEISSLSGGLSGNDLIRYHTIAFPTVGYLDCSFDDLKSVPDTIREQGGLNVIGNYFTYIIRNKKDSTYSKVQIIKKMENGRYIYKYGTNTVPNNKLLIDTGYDRSLKYKPNNLYNLADVMGPYPNRLRFDSLYWDPPIQNNNHLLGYILYASKSKGGVGIDTAKPIDTTQWDSVAFYPNTANKAALSAQEVNGSYINLVALYEEGKSEFLDGWTRLNVVPVSVARPEPVYSPVQKKVSITAVPGGVFITAPYLPSSELFSVSIYNPNGSLHTRISGIKGNRAFLGNNFAGGLYLLRAEFPDRSVIMQPFIISR